MFELSREGGVLVARVRGPRGNAIGPAFVSGLAEVLERARDPGVRGLLLLGDGRFFSTGLDLVGLPEMPREAFEAFVGAFRRVFLELYAFGKPVVAGIHGAAFAGGALLAFACDHRVLSSAARIAVRGEEDVGVPYPVFAVELVREALGPDAPVALYGGPPLAPAEALARRWVHETAPPEETEARALDAARRYAAKVPETFASTKRLLRAPTLERIRESESRGEDRFVETWFLPGPQERIRAMRERLRSRG